MKSVGEQFSKILCMALKTELVRKQCRRGLLEKHQLSLVLVEKKVEFSVTILQNSEIPFNMY